MATLIADRFLLLHECGERLDGCGGLDLRRATPALDLATGSRVRLCIQPAGSRAEQQTWTETCVRAHADGRILDFGFVGTAQRFEARAPNCRRDLRACAHASAIVAVWLQHTSPFSSRLIRLEE